MFNCARVKGYHCDTGSCIKLWFCKHHPHNSKHIITRSLTIKFRCNLLKLSHSQWMKWYCGKVMMLTVILCPQCQKWIPSDSVGWRRRDAIPSFRIYIWAMIGHKHGICWMRGDNPYNVSARYRKTWISSLSTSSNPHTATAQRQYVCCTFIMKLLWLIWLS